MRKSIRRALVLAMVLSVPIAGLYGYYRYKFPYGSTHRCSRVLAGLLEEYADQHGGRYPVTDEGRLGLAKILDPAGTHLDLVVGKAGNLAEARRFHGKHGYLLENHSSWHYVSGLTTADAGRALAWDKIPLEHNGMRNHDHSREVILVGGMIKMVPESRWETFLKEQAELSKQKP